MEVSDCPHPDGVYLYDATDGDGNDLVVYRCTECGRKYTEGR